MGNHPLNNHGYQRLRHLLEDTLQNVNSYIKLKLKQEKLKASREAELEVVYQKYLNLPITILGLSFRVHQLLMDNGIHKISQLESKTQTDLLKTKYLGRKAVNEIKDALLEHGLSLGSHIINNEGE